MLARRCTAARPPPSCPASRPPPRLSSRRPGGQVRAAVTVPLAPVRAVHSAASRLLDGPPDAPPADRAGGNLDVAAPIAAGPRLHAQRAQFGELIGGGHDHGLAADQNAPALGQVLVQVVDLERHPGPPAAAARPPRVAVRKTMSGPSIRKLTGTATGPRSLS